MTYKITAYTQGARWVVASGLANRESADRALQALLAKDGLRAHDSSGRLVPATFSIDVEDD